MTARRGTFNRRLQELIRRIFLVAGHAHRQLRFLSLAGLSIDIVVRCCRQLRIHTKAKLISNTLLDLLCGEIRRR